MARIFIAYPDEHLHFASILARSLSAVGADVWLDVENLPPEIKRYDAIQHGLEACDLMLVIITPESMQSQDMEAQWFYFLQNEKPIIPILYRQARMHYLLSPLGQIDFEKTDYERAFRRLHQELLQRGCDLTPLPESHVETAPPQHRKRIGKPDRQPGGNFFQTYPLETLIKMVVSAVSGVLLALLIRGYLFTSEAAAPQPTAAYVAAPQPTVTPIALPANPTIHVDWEPVARDFNGTTMVQVPPGCFIIGARTNNEVCLDQPYWIDQYETTNMQFLLFLSINGNRSPEGFAYLDAAAPDAHIYFSSETWMIEGNYGNHPVTEVTWFGARDYCRWRGGYLPTEAEWEYAARGPNELLYPWGNNWDTNLVVYADTVSTVNTEVVGSRPGGVSWVGALDMSGNVREWTNSLYINYPYDKDDGREADTGSQIDVRRSLRGGSWKSDMMNVRAGSRGGGQPNDSANDWGFRCVQSDDGESPELPFYG